ncbi:LysR family transcriptional regulator [Jejubacter calystegiae]|uniref:LysR family transcriptional regulator n=1 Tax=Jejubacter calystegiae TaxID=2579935 RepID=A0A4P8YE41_9ENTR|nr:LysR family transcriptional regulator [Jejubacter calystegiae]QCT18885.1 LysR family transcriptional regulator [Jejubacter calystegiae]
MNNVIDIKALKAIHILTTCGSVTKTAELLNVSPGTISYILNKARKKTGSALFFRTRNGMAPDNIAKELSQYYQSITNKMKQIPLENRSLTISTYSLIELLISAKLNVSGKLPATMKFSAPDFSEEIRLARLRNKEIDLDIGTRLPNDHSIIQIEFMSCDTCIVASKSHPTIKTNFTMSDWESNQHIIWSRSMGLTCNDFQHANRFNELINKRNVAIISSNALNMIALCAYSNYIMLMPTLIIQYFENRLPIRIFTAPPELKMRFDCYLHYHHSLANNARLSSILNEIQNTIQSKSTATGL